MKKYAYIGWALALVIFLTACSSGKMASASRSDEYNTVIQVVNPLSLADMLARAPGVFVYESGSHTSVKIRGGSPLFVLNSVPLGNSYASAANAVNVHNITAIEVLKSPSETIMYGRDAGNGVIVIHTRAFDKDRKEH